MLDARRYLPAAHLHQPPLELRFPPLPGIGLVGIELRAVIRHHRGEPAVVCDALIQNLQRVLAGYTLRRHTDHKV